MRQEHDNRGLRMNQQTRMPHIRPLSSSASGVIDRDNGHDITWREFSTFKIGLAFLFMPERLR